MASYRGFSSFAAVLLVILVLGLASLFMWRVWSYYAQITSGQTVELPQFTGAFTSAGAGSSPVTGAHPEVATADDPSIGPADAKLTVVEFLDYQCPYCGEEFPIVRELNEAHKNDVRFIIRDFPVPELHPDALAGAEAAGCAQAQDKFWPMHDHLFALQGQLTAANIDKAAQQSGVDLDRFHACLDGHERLQEIQADATDAVAAGVRGTPTFFFNGSKVEGAIPHDVFVTLINRYLSP